MSNFEKKMACRYLSHKDLCDRLMHTFIRYKDVPVYVYEVSKGPNRLVLQHLGKEECFYVLPDDPDLDISAFELGYVNTDNSVTMICRGTAKHYKQGTCIDHLWTRGIDKDDDEYHADWKGRPFFELLLDKYPTLNEAKTWLDNGRPRVAISKGVALQKTKVGVIHIYVRGVEVGWMTPDMGHTYIPDSPISWIVKQELSENGLYARRY